MWVNVTPAQFRRAQELALELDADGMTRRRPMLTVRDELIELLTAAARDNGGDFNPDFARRGIATRLQVVVKVKP